MNQNRTVAILVVILLVLGGIAYWDEQQTKKDEQSAASEKRLTDLTVAAIERLVYRATDDDENESSLEIEVVKTESGDWQVRKPMKAEGDKAAIEVFIKTLVEYKYERALPDAGVESWEKYGLKRPKRSVELHPTGGAPSFTYFIGDKSAVGYSAYLRTSESTQVYLGSQYLLASTAKQLRDFRNKKVIDIDLDKLSSVRLHRGKEQIEIEKKSGAYQIVKPQRYDTDQEEVSDFLSEVSGLIVEEFRPNASPVIRKSFKKPFISLSWTYGESKETTRLLFSRYKNELWATFDPTKEVFKFAVAAKDKIDKKVDDFRERRMLRVESVNFASVEVDGEVYRKVNDDWYLASEADAAAKEGPDKPKPRLYIQNLVVDLSLAKTEAFLAKGAVARKLTGAPQHRIKVWFADDLKQDPVTLEAWPDKLQTDRFLVKVSNREAIYYIRSDVFANTKPEVKKSLNNHE